MNKKKNYPSEVIAEVTLISEALRKLFDSNKSNYRVIAKYTGLSVNSVRSVLGGKTANIATYSMIARALGSNLIDIVKSIQPAVEQV